MAPAPRPEAFGSHANGYVVGMSATWVLYIVGLALLVLVFFALLWWFDARRAKEVKHDRRRAEPDPAESHIDDHADDHVDDH